MLTLYITLICTLLALWITWKYNLYSLRILLISMFSYDVAGLVLLQLGLARGSKAFWYYYWLSRSASFLLQSLVVLELLFTAPTIYKFGARFWGIGCLILQILVLAYIWSKPITLNSMMDVSVVSGLLIGMSSILALLLKAKYRSVITGSLVWSSLLVFFGIYSTYFNNVYPIAALLPLSVWCTSSLIERRKYDSGNKGSVRFKGTDGGELQSKRAASGSRRTREVFQGAARQT